MNNKVIKIYHLNEHNIDLICFNKDNISFSLTKKMKPFFRDEQGNIPEDSISADKQSIVIKGIYPVPLVNQGDRLIVYYTGCATKGSYFQSEIKLIMIVTAIIITGSFWELVLEEL